MSFTTCYEQSDLILMEGALGERLKREYNLFYDNALTETVALSDIIYREGGKEALCEIWRQYISTAKARSLPFIATTPTRRANRERVYRAGYNERIIYDNVSLLKKLRDVSDIEMYIGGLMGSKGDSFKADEVLQPDEAFKFHSWQADLFREAGVDFLFAGIMPAVPEAIGMARAMEATGLPYIISLMLTENGRLIDGTTINDAIEMIDSSVNRQPICYMTNCVHPSVLYKALSWDFNRTSLVKERFHGIQANAAAFSPEELDNSVELKCSDCTELAESMFKLTELISLKIVGGCCGTDNTHLEKIAQYMSS